MALTMQQTPWRSIGEAYPFNTDASIAYWAWHVYAATSQDGATAPSSPSKTRSRSATTSSSSTNDDAQAHERARRVLQRMHGQSAGFRQRDGSRGGVVRAPVPSTPNEHLYREGGYHGMMSSSPTKASAGFGYDRGGAHFPPSPPYDPYVALSRSPEFSASAAGPASPTRSAGWMPHSPPKRFSPAHRVGRPSRNIAGAPLFAPVPPLIPMHLGDRAGSGPRHPRHGAGLSASTSPTSPLDVDPERLTPLAKEMWELERERRGLQRERRALLHQGRTIYGEGHGFRGPPRGPELVMFA